MTDPTRQHPQYEIEVEVVYTRPSSPDVGTEHAAHAVCARRLSQEGLLLEAPEHLPVGTRLRLSVLRGKPEAIDILGEVVWSEAAEDEPLVRHGIRILQMDPLQERAWASFVDVASREGRRSLRFDIHLPVTCSGDDGKPLGGHAVAVNVSRGGLLVLLSVRVPVGTRLWVEVRTPSQRLKAEARVVRLEAERRDGLVPHGLAFAGAEGSELLPELFLLGLL